jgi:hypothetical protein
MVAGTAASLGFALANDRRLTPALVEAAPARPIAAPPLRGRPGIEFHPREALRRQLGAAALIALAVITILALIPGITAVVGSLRASPATAAVYGPPLELRAGANVSASWERSFSVAAPRADEVGAVLIAGAIEQRQWDVLHAMLQIERERAAAAAAVAPGAALAARPAAQPHSMNGASGLAVGTVLSAHITIYGCVGPGGGFCNYMASGGVPFEGAAACSSNLPFGTRVKIHGDPTGRIYECLDRGALPATWIDVFFYNTSDGMAWQSALGSTSTTIEIVN